MAPIPVLNCVQLDMKMLAEGQTIQNSFFYQLTASPTADELVAMAGAAADAWTAHFAPILSHEVSLGEIVATDLTGLAGPRIVFPVTPAVDGGAGTAIAPLNVTFAVKRVGATRGRGTSGRIFWPTVAATEVALGQIDPAYITSALAALDSFDNAVVAGSPVGTEPCIAHKAGLHAGTSTPLISWSVSDNYVDSQRDRLARHKRHRKPRTP